MTQALFHEIVIVFCAFVAGCNVMVLIMSVSNYFKERS